MNVVRTGIPDVLILEPKIFRDDRGLFLESYNERELDAVLGGSFRFPQDNHSRSRKGVLRGLHYQLPPHAQGKLVRVTCGAVFDVAVDVRRRSATFGRWVGVELSGDNHRQMWIPPGLAHGFLVLSDSADVLYKTTEHYARDAEACIRWDDPDLAIHWPDVGIPPVLSPRDAAAPPFSRAPAGDALPGSPP